MTPLRRLAWSLTALVPFYLSGIFGSLLATQLLVLTDGDLRPLWLLGGLFAGFALIPASRLPHSRG